MTEEIRVQITEGAQRLFRLHLGKKILDRRARGQALRDEKDPCTIFTLLVLSALVDEERFVRIELEEERDEREAGGKEAQEDEA